MNFKTSVPACPAFENRMNMLSSYSRSREIANHSSIISSVSEVRSQPIFLDLKSMGFGYSAYLKLEALNAAGSIKFKAAAAIIDDLEALGVLTAGKKVVESSSGNLGLALAIICASRGYQFICVSDPNISPPTAALIKAYGATLVIVNRRDSSDGFLQERIATIRRMQDEDPSLVWTNQYANLSNPGAHYRSTGPEILHAFPDVQAVFIGAGTTGTLMGCARFFRERAPDVRVIAVDSVGSILFSNTASKRHLPGLGASRIPELLDRALVHDVILIEERETVAICREFAKLNGLLLGPSSGTVLAGIRKYTRTLDSSGPVVAISPDLGDRYIDTLYNDTWVRDRFGDLDFVRI